MNSMRFKNRRVYGYETETQLVDGTTKWFALYSFLDDSDQLIYGFSLDITDHKQAEGRIQRERDQAQMYLDVAGVVLIALDRSGDIILANKKCCGLLGQREEDLLGQPWFDRFVPEEARNEVKAIFAQLMDGRMDNYVEHYENPIISASGESRIVNWHNTIMRDHQGNIICSFSSGEDVTEQRKAEARLADEQAETRRLLEFQELVLSNMGSGILVTDTYGEIILANPQARRILGATGHVLTGTMLSDIVPGLSVMLDPEYQSDEIRLVLSDGRAVVLGFNRNPIRDEELNQVGMVVIFQDITAFQMAQESLRESEERLRTVTEFTYDWEYWNSPEGIPLWISPSCERITGYRPQEFIEDHELLLKIVHPDDRHIFESHLCMVNIQEKNLRDMEFRIITRDGQTRWVGHVCHPVVTADGRYLGQRISNRDITERKRTEEKLREREETYRALVEGIPDIVMRFDEFGRHVFVSRNMDELVDIPARDFIGRTHRELGFDENLCGFFETAIQRVFASGYPLETEFSILGKHGLVIFNWRLIPETDHAGRTHTVLTIAHDVTDKKRVEAEKEDLQRKIAHTQKLQAIGTLAGGIAHDFNNILGVIIGNSELFLQADHFADDESRTDMKLVLDAGLRGRHLVRQILAFSRKEQVEKQPVDINLIAKETAKMLKSLIPSTIRFKWNLSATPSRVLADPTQMQQVLINLASNAADAVGENGEISLTVSREVVDSETPLIQAGIKPGEYISVQLRDNGSGIAPAMLDRIFEPFFTTKPPGKGTGLGLAVVHGIVTSHGGAIGVRSNPGQGTTFTVYLPPVEDEVSSHDLSSVRPSMKGTGRILLVDDETSVLRTMERILVRLGFEITSYNSSTDALHDFRHSPRYYDLVISDVVMPNLNGERLAREILAIRPEVPMILYSGSLPSEGILRLQQTARVSFISKPIGIRELFDVIRGMMEANRNSRPGG